MTTGTQPPIPSTPPPVGERLTAIEKRLEKLTPEKDRWDKSDQTALTNCWVLFNVAQSEDFRGRFRFPEKVGATELGAKTAARRCR